MREIVGAQIGTLITNNPSQIREAVESGANMRFLDRAHMQFMAAMDLGKRWENMASGPTLFMLDENNKPHAPNEDR